MTAPERVRIVLQDEEVPDCAVASLAHFAGITYGAALVAFPRPDRVMSRGAWMTELQAAAATLGIETKVLRKFNIEEDTGILWLKGKKGDDDHVCYLWAGRIIDGTGECYLSPFDFLRVCGGKPKSLLVRLDQ